MAQVPPDLSYRLRWWQTDDGLPKNPVHAIAQTRDGYLWVGTEEGLARFDGLQFTPVDERAVPELRSGSISALRAGRDGTLWIAGDTFGLYRLKDGVFSHFTETNGLPSNQCRCLWEARDGALWVGTEAGAAVWKSGAFTVLTTRDGLSDNSVRAICSDRQGRVFFGTRRGLTIRGLDGTCSIISFPGGWTANALRAVCEDREGRLWVGSTDGLYCLQGTNQTYLGISAGLPSSVVNAVYEDQAGQVWVATYSGLVRLVADTMTCRETRDTSVEDMVNALYEDAERNLWVASRDGLLRFTPARFRTYTTQQGLTRNNVMSVCQDRSGTMWLGIWGGGLNALRGETVTPYSDTHGLTRDSVLSLCEGRDGTLYLGMDFDRGLDVFKEGRRVSLPRAAGALIAPVRVIREDREGALWVGTSQGLNILKGESVETFTSTNGLPADVVLALLEDGQGGMWVGTDGGLSCRRGGRFTTYTTHNGLSHNTINALYEDADKVLWVGTRGGGLNRFKNGQFKAITTRQGLFRDEVYEILEDNSGFFWMSCREGIFRVAKTALDQVADGKRARVSCTAFDRADGLVSVQCNGVSKPAGWKDRDGRLWFPTIRGVVAVEARLKTNERPPPVAIEQVTAEGRILRRNAVDGRADAELQVPPGRGELGIQFTALSLQAPDKNRFRYILEGADSDWSEVTAERTARYSHLAPGRYRFRVIASNNDGVWNEAGASLALVLLPHYWQTWWFKGAMLALVVLGLTLAYRLRVARLREIERLRVEIAANLHDDVGARLTKVAMITELVEQETPEQDRNKGHVHTIAQTTRDIIQAMDEIVWTINPRNDTLDNLANYIFHYAQEYFQNTRVRCRLDVPAQLPERAISTETRHNFFMAVKEALNNVLKHAGAEEVRITLTAEDGKLVLTITDDGRGFVVNDSLGRGEGLLNMKQRLEAIGGHLAIESKPGQGASIRMEADVS